MRNRYLSPRATWRVGSMKSTHRKAGRKTWRPPYGRTDRRAAQAAIRLSAEEA